MVNNVRYRVTGVKTPVLAPSKYEVVTWADWTELTLMPHMEPTYCAIGGFMAQSKILIPPDMQKELLPKIDDVLELSLNFPVSLAGKRLCKDVAMLKCKVCGRNLCNEHATQACKHTLKLTPYYPHDTEWITTHKLDNITASYCMVEV